MIALENEKKAKSQIMNFLAKQGYPRYAALLSNFDVNLTADPDTVAYVENDRARIVVNKNLYLEQLSVVIRHELLHRWLRHNYRLGQHVGQDKWDKRTHQQHMIGNIAADYEISNRGYTDEDKEVVRHLMIKDKEMRGLVTEDDHPDWVDMSVEEMYDKLTEMKEREQEAFQKFLDELIKNGLYQDLENNSEGTSGGSDGGSEKENNNNNSQNSQGSTESGENKDDKQSNSSSGSSSVTVNIEDIGRALKVKKGQQSGGNKNQASDYNGVVDDLIDAVDKTLKDIEDNPNMSKEEKEEKAKDLLNKIKEKTQQGKEKSNEEPTYDKSKEDINKELKDIAKKLEREVAEDEEELNNPDLDRATIDKNIDLRIKNISDLFNDTAELNAAIEETEKKQYEISQKERSKELKKKEFNSTTYNRELFLKQLDRLIQSQLKRIQQGTYKVPSKKRAFGSNVLYRGTHWEEKRKKPSVIVYYDRSGSWQVPWKTKAGDDAISMLNDKYVRRGLIDLKLRYFADKVSNNPNNVGSGNRASQEILDDIVQQKATNVIILTDSDINGGYTSPVTVPGGVFFIFVEYQSPELTKYLHGKQLNQVYFIKSESAN